MSTKIEDNVASDSSSGNHKTNIADDAPEFNLTARPVFKRVITASDKTRSRKLIRQPVHNRNFDDEDECYEPSNMNEICSRNTIRTIGVFPLCDDTIKNSWNYPTFRPPRPVPLWALAEGNMAYKLSLLEDYY